MEKNYRGLKKGLKKENYFSNTNKGKKLQNAEKLKGVFHGSAHVQAYQHYPLKNPNHMYSSILQ